MTYFADFDRIIDRTPTSSLKWVKYKNRDILPLWVADLDFESPPAVMQALYKRTHHGVFGYTLAPEELVDVIIERMDRLYSWKIESDWIVWIPCLVCGFNLACRAVGNDGDDVMSVTPVYPPFLDAPGNSRRNLIKVPLDKSSGKWVMDLEKMQDALTDKTGLLLFCNPHNPTGRAYTRDELLELTEFCEKNDLIICSDEIHCDLLLDEDVKHIPTASLDPEIAKRTITLMSPSKTYNIAGLGCGFGIISDPDLRERYKKEMAGIVPHINIMGYTAALAAFKDGQEWLTAVLKYLQENRDLLEKTVADCHCINMTHVEATYLAWIDVRELGLENPIKFFEQHGLGFSDGADFDFDGFVRFNFGCPRPVLNKALERLFNAVRSVTS